MMRMTFALLLAAPLWLAGCPADEGGGDDMGVDMAVMTIPTPPGLGAQIDRMGRPAINTALNNTFHPDDAVKNAAKDANNAEGNEANWSSVIVGNKPAIIEYAASLAIIDALDGKCGNQVLAAGGGGDAGAMGYTALASVLIDDELYVDTAKTNCLSTELAPGVPVPNYLAVEARFLGLPFPSCGGRTPLDDTIDVTYSLLAAGTDMVHVSDGIDSDADQATPPSLTEFPFLRNPN